MSARSSALLELLAVLAAAGCGSKVTAAEADPQKVASLAQTMVKNTPVPAAVRECKYEELLGGATLTQRTVMQLAGDKAFDDKHHPELSEFVNPTELDSPAARTLVDGTDAGEKRRAAAELLAAPFHLVYHVDLVDTPLALGVKDFKRGSVGARAIRYDTAGAPTCVLVFFWSNTPAKQAWAIKKTDHPDVDPAVAKELQQDLRAQMLVRVAGLAAPPPPPDPSIPVDDRSERN